VFLKIQQIHNWRHDIKVNQNRGENFAAMLKRLLEDQTQICQDDI
jgi:hypothetical protein